MKYWDSVRQIQRLVESLRPMEEQIQRLQLVSAQMRAPLLLEDQVRQMNRVQEWVQETAAPFIRAQDLLEQFARTQAVLMQPAALLASSELLQASIRPIPDLRALGLDPDYMASIAARLNAGILDAGFLGELDLSEGEAGEEPEPTDEAAIQTVESRLVEIASPESLETLRSVDFAPIVLLDRALRNPGMMRQMEARDFESFIASLVEQLGFEDVVLTPGSRDQGRDVLATKHVHGISIFFAFECKRYSADRPVGPDIARALLGTISHAATRATKGVLVTTSRFTPAARRFILTEPSLDGRDFDGIVEWLREYATKKHAT
jgi:hypothetical protein